MINPIELRIGNFVNTMEDNSYPYGEIFTIDKEFINVSGDIFNKEDFKYIHHITLSKEWLINLGFIFKYNQYIFPTSKLDVYGWDHDVIWINDGDFVLKFNETQIKNIKYVHELQNLYFALTGNELIYQTVSL